MGRTLGPHRSDEFEPSLQLLAKFSWARIVSAAELANKPELAEEWNPLSPPSREAAIREPGEQVERRRARRERLCRFQVRRDRMAGDLPVELLAENDYVLTIARQECLFQVSRIPNPGLPHEIEAGAMHHSGPVSLRVGAEEDRCAEDALE